MPKHTEGGGSPALTQGLRYLSSFFRGHNHTRPDLGSVLLISLWLILDVAWFNVSKVCCSTVAQVFRNFNAKNDSQIGWTARGELYH